jgi:glutathione S-transferase
MGASVLELQIMPRVGWGWLNASPFCLKALTYLRLTETPHEVRETWDLQPAPKGKLPYAVMDGVPVGDSETIVRRVRSLRGDPLREEALPDAERRRLHALRRVVEESLYFALLVERWSDEAVWPAYRSAIASALPWPLRHALPPIVRRKVLRITQLQGYGRHRLDEVQMMAREDLECLGEALGSRPFFAGDTPHAIDASVFGLLANLLYVPLHSPLHGCLTGVPSLVAFTHRLRERCERPGDPAPQTCGACSAASSVCRPPEPVAH